MVRGGLSLRVDLQPVVLMPFDSLGADPELLVQHAVEVQYGHTFGAGVRLQASPTPTARTPARRRSSLSW